MTKENKNKPVTLTDNLTDNSDSVDSINLSKTQFIKNKSSKDVSENSIIDSMTPYSKTSFINKSSNSVSSTTDVTTIAKKNPPPPPPKNFNN